MECEEFRSNPFRGIPTGLISGFMYGCIILLIALALGMEEKLFIPLLAAAVILGGIIGFIIGIGKAWKLMRTAYIDDLDNVFIEWVSNGRLTAFSKKNFKSLFEMAG